MTKKTVLIVGFMVFDLLLLAAYLFGSFFFANILIDRPTRNLEESRVHLDDWAAEYGLANPMRLEPTAPEAISFQSGDVVIRGSYYDNPEEGQCGVVFLHGYTNTRYGMIPYTPLFWDYGCDLLLYDARGHGDSDDDYHTYGYYEKEDAREAVAWLANRAGLSTSQIGLMGVSYGGATSLQTAPLVPDLAFIITDSPYQDLESIVRHQAVAQFGDVVRPFIPGAWWVAGRLADFEVSEVSALTAVAQTEIPLLLIHSLQDEFTPASHSEAIYKAANSETAVLHLLDWNAPHAAAIATDYAQYEVMVDDFLATHAPDFGQP